MSLLSAALALLATLPAPRPDVDLGQLNGFPPLAAAECECKLCELRWNYEKLAFAGSRFYVEAEWHSWEADLIWRHWCLWEDLTVAQNEHVGESTRLDRLRRLRSKLGDDNYYAGRMPDWPGWMWRER